MNRIRLRLTFLFVLVWMLTLCLESSNRQVVKADQSTPTISQNDKSEQLCKNARENSLPLPGTLSLQEFEKQLYPFILKRTYATEYSWCVDKGVRDTGPWILGKYYGTHPAVRIYYSPRVMYWLTGNPDYWREGKESGKAISKKPREGKVPEGGMIIKEMFLPPAARYTNWPEEKLVNTLYTDKSPGWTVMIKDSAGSHDGWFWSSVFVNEPFDSGGYPFAYPHSGFGQSCLRCHAVAEKESTFSSLRNINGFPGSPMSYFVDDTWRNLPRNEYPWPYEHGRPMVPQPRSLPVVDINEDFLKTFHSLDPVPYEKVQKFPSESLDRVVASSEMPEEFISSDQCMMCHSGGASNYGAFGPVMFIETGPNPGDGLNISPYGEWRWSPMGLAGRDPIFHAQLESEISILKQELPANKAALYARQTVNTCLLCHGAMGKRQYDIDKKAGNKYWLPKADFNLDWFYLSDPGNQHAKFGGLGRDGISCTVCHHMDQEYTGIRDFLENSITGQFTQGKPKELFGPFKADEITPLPMENSLGINPKYHGYIKKSRLCGSCHTINLPVVDYPLDNPPNLSCNDKPDPELNKPDKNPNFKNFMHKIEQATYLEWLNSTYQNEFKPFSNDAKSCQDCHMPEEYHSPDEKINIKQIKTKIAFVEDQDYPDSDNRSAVKDIHVRFREEGFRRHKLQGLNIFMAEMFNQFNDILGVRLTDYETGTAGNKFAINNFVQQARKNTAKLEIINYQIKGNEVTADVRVTNKTGHRFPSGVGFRRAFIEFLVIDQSDGRERVIWASGRTNEVGVIVDGKGNILPSEFLNTYEKEGKTLQHYQQHWQVIDSQDKVQIYEELTQNAKGEFTTSFIHRDCEIKDNRLLPRGWTLEGPSPSIPQAFIAATHPGPEARSDPEYQSGSGTDIVTYRVALPVGINPENIIVKATLYSQAWAPYYLHQRFTNVPDGPEGNARRRLYYLASNLKVEGTPIEDWKLQLVSDYAPKRK